MPLRKFKNYGGGGTKKMEITNQNLMSLTQSLNQNNQANTTSSSASLSSVISNAQTSTNNEQTSTQSLSSLTQSLNEQMTSLGTNIRFAYDESYKGLTVRVIDKNTGDVIRQIPSEEAIKMAQYFKNALGLIFDKEY